MEMFATRIVTYLLGTFNTIILLYGLFLAGSGVMIVQDMRSFSYFLENKILWLPYFLTFNGIMMVVLAVAGFWATHRKNYNLLVTFFISGIVVLLIELGLITWMSSGNPLFIDQLRVSLKRSFTNYTFVDLDRKSWDQLQRKIRCCGIDSPQDWYTIYAKNQVPASCCTIAPDQPGVLCRNTPDSEIVYQYGCHQILFKRISDYWSVVSLLAALAVFFQVIVLLLSLGMGFLVKRAKAAKDRQ